MAGREFELIFKLQAAVGTNFKSSFLQAKTATVELEKNISNLNKTSRNIDGLKRTEASLQTSTAKLEAQKEQLAELKQQQDAAGGSSKKLAADIARQEESISKTESTIRKQNASLENYQKELKEAGVDTGNLSSETSKLSTQLEKATAAQEKMAKIGALQAENKKAISETKTKLLGVTGVATAVGAALYAGPVKGAMEFESSMADVAKVVDGLKDSSGALTPEYHKMKNEILDLTDTIPMTANELTQIAAAAGQAGIARKEIAGFTSDAAKMGVAFDVTADQAGDWMAKWRTSFGLTQTQVVELADKINYLSDTSAAEASQIATIVTNVGPLGEVAGFASGEIAALGATLVGIGISEDVASTGIKKLMTTMTAGESTTKKQNAVLQRLGISATDLADRMQTDATGAVMDFMRALQKLPKAEQAAALKDYFGQESIGAIAPLLTNLDLLKEQFNKVGDASQYAGSMEEEFATRSKTTENSIQLAKNALKKLSITVGNELLPIVSSAAQKAAEVIKKVNEFAAKNPTVVKAILSIGAGLLGAKAGALGLKLGLLNLKDALLGLRAGFQAVKALSLTKGLGSIKTLLSGLTGSIGPIIAGVLAIAVAIKLLINNSEAVRNKIQELFGEGGVAIFDKFIATLNMIKDTISNLFSGNTEGALGSFFQHFQIGGPIIESIKGLIENLAQAIPPIISAVSEFAQSIGPTLLQILGNIITTILPIVIEILAQLIPIIQKAAEGILPILAGIISTIAGVIMNIASIALPLLAGIMQFIMPIITKLAGILSGTLQAALILVGAAVQQVAALVGGLIGIFSGLIDFIAGVFTGNWGRAWEGVKNIFGSAFNALIGIAKAPINAVMSLVNKAIGALNTIQIPKWVPVVGGKGINIPKIPTLWKGSAHTPDTFIAGEQGPELVMGKGGSKVFTAHTTKGIFTGLKDSFLSAKEMLTGFSAPNLNPAGPSLALAGAGGGRSIVINSQPHFHLMSGDPTEIGKVLDENNEKLKREIKEEMENEDEDRRRRGY